MFEHSFVLTNFHLIPTILVGTINTIASLTGHSFLHCLCGTTYDLRIFFWYRKLSRELFSTRAPDQTLIPMSSPNCWPLYGPYAARVPNRLHSTGGPHSARQCCNQRCVRHESGCPLRRYEFRVHKSSSMTIEQQMLH